VYSDFIQWPRFHVVIFPWFLCNQTKDALVTELKLREDIFAEAVQGIFLTIFVMCSCGSHTVL
jgi:hypothetical protein